ncbi:hypothetical protein [uncultured Brevundimonas sp.]|uniref:hypothetical protein n=1 Tax=uncultured Brevundimonas sp. TaxID=213418 RepID=UPI00260EFAEF|nr:hypothetical protein [uncultured Brevundimonas sp.]
MRCLKRMSASRRGATPAAAAALCLAFAAGGAVAADLMVTKTGGGPAGMGQTRTFVIVAGNVSSLTLPPNLTVTVTDVLPPTFTQIAASGAGWSCSVAGQTVTCARADGLGAGQSFAPITVAAVVGGGQAYSSCAQVAHAVNAATQPDLVAANNTACVSGAIVPGPPRRRHQAAPRGPNRRIIP